MRAQATRHDDDAKTLAKRIRTQYSVCEMSKVAHVELTNMNRKFIAQQMAGMTEADHSFYDAVTKKLDKERPIVPQAISTTTEVESVDDDVVDVLDSHAVLAENDARPLQERIFDASRDLVDREDSVDVPKRVHVYAVHSAGYRIENSLYSILQPHQKEALEMMLRAITDARGLLVAHGTGTGKTLLTLAMIHACKHKFRIVVVCPKTLVRQWETELERYTPDAGSHTVTINDPRPINLWRRFGDVLILGKEKFVTMSRKGNIVLTAQDILVVDEAQIELKTGSTHFYKTVAACKTRRRILLSGTPIENKLEELYNIVKLVDADILGRDYAEFFKNFGDVIERGMQPLSTDEQLSKSKVQKHILRRLLSKRVAHFVSSEQVLATAIPTKIDWVVMCDGVNVPMCESDGVLEQWHTVHARGLPIKKMACELLVDQIRQAFPNEHIVIFSQRRFMLHELAKSRPGVGILDGLTYSHDERQKMLTDFKKTPGGLIYIGIKVGGVGLDLNFVSRVILLDVSWNPMADWQAVARAHRFGQTRTVRVYRLVAKSTLEERAYTLGVSKSMLAASIVDDSDVTRVYSSSLFDSTESFACHYLNPSAIHNDRCLQNIARQYKWMHVMHHTQTVKSMTMETETELTACETATANNCYNFMFADDVLSARPPVAMSVRCKPMVTFRAGKDAIMFRLDLETLQDSSVQLFVKQLAPMCGDWTPIIYEFKCEFENRTHVEIATTRTGGFPDDHRLGRGEFIFKARRVSDASSTVLECGPESATLFVV